MFVNHYKNIPDEIKNYISVKEKDFNNSPKNVRKFLIETAHIKKDEEDKKILFEDIPSDIKDHIEVDKESFEELDILCQQFIIKYVFKYKEILNKKDERKNNVYTNVLERYDKYNISKSNYLENFIFDLNVILKNNYYINSIINIKENLKINLEKNNKCMKRLKANIRNNRNKIICNTIKKDVSFYEEKIIHYEKELNKVSSVYSHYKNLYTIFTSLINLINCYHENI